MLKPWRDRASLGNPRIDTRPMWSLFLSGGRAHATYRRSWQSGRTRAARSASSDTVRSVGARGSGHARDGQVVQDQA